VDGLSANEVWYAQVEGFPLSTATFGRERRREAGLGLRVVLFRWLLRLGGYRRRGTGWSD
jgi:hypothetical protein